MRTLTVDRRQERALGGSAGDESKEFTDGTHVIRQPGITTGREAQGTQTSLEQSRSKYGKPTGDSKLDGVEQQRRTRGCTCWVRRSVERALGGGRETGDGRQLCKCHSCLPR